MSNAAEGVPDKASVARFAADLETVWPLRERSGSHRLGVAVSGGPDSTALLLLANAALPGAVEAATVDHQLRPENAAEAAQVAALCATLDIPHRTLVVSVGAGNLQAQARASRYAALAGWCEAHDLAALATAHHADDQAETVLLRLNRASGVAGLAGTRARGTVAGFTLPLVRPLLGWRRSELAAIVTAAGIVAVDDPSNRDDRFDRARIRQALGQADWLDVAAIAASAAHLADADAALTWAARREWREQVRENSAGTTYRQNAPRAVALRVITRIVERLDNGSAPRGGAIAGVFDALVAARPASIGAVLARPGADGWSFTRAPSRAPLPR